MLIACHCCHRQYDVGSLEVGAKVRCHCGEVNVIPEQRAHEAKLQHCASCGGHLRDGASECEYCGGAVSLRERRIGNACPECFARLAVDANFCNECGIKIQAELVATALGKHDCPRCDGKLLQRDVAAGAFTECSSCGGLWLSEESFERLVDRREEASLPPGLESLRRPTSPEIVYEKVSQVRYVPCPKCGDLMNRKNFASCSGVVIDWCKGHGYWFDTHELEQVLKFVAEGGLDKSRQREAFNAEQRRRRQDLTEAVRRPGAEEYRGSTTTAGGFRGLDSEMPFDLFTVLRDLVRGWFKR